MKVVLFSCAIKSIDNEYASYIAIGVYKDLKHIKKHITDYHKNRQQGAIVFRTVYAGDFNDSRKNIINTIKNSGGEYSAFNGYDFKKFSLPMNLSNTESRVNDIVNILSNDLFDKKNENVYLYDKLTVDRVIEDNLVLNPDGISYSLK